jgi:chlorobactene glucosyltransferase
MLPYIVAATTGLAGIACATTLLNVVAWPRGGASRRDAAPTGPPPRVSVLIPARNEETTIRQAVESAFSGTIAPLEVIVCDDASTDQTPALLEEMQSRWDNLRVIRGAPLPDGWIGKPHACYQLAQAATGDVLLFLDADTTLHAEGIERTLRLSEQWKADVVTVVPRQRTETLAERVVLPMLHVTYASWLPMMLVPWTRDPRFLAANGQVLAFKRSTYDAIGGFAAVRDEVVDDMAICRRAKQQGFRVVFGDGHKIAECRMYEGAAQVWTGFSKNLYEGIGEHPLALVGVIGLYSGAFLAPWFLTAATAVAAPALLPWAALGVAFNLVQRTVQAVRHAQSPWAVLLHPVGVVALLAIAVNSFRWSLTDRVEWSGRVYASRRRRKGAAPCAPATPAQAAE